MRIRLFAGMAVAAALLALTACRSSPDVAAYVGDTAITEARVTKLIDDFAERQRAFAREQAEKGQPVQEPEPLSRKFVVDLLAQAEICQRLRAKLGFDVQEPSLPPDAPELFVINERTNACIDAIPAAPIEPTEADAREIFDRGVRLGVIEPGQFDEIRDNILGDRRVAAALGQRKLIKENLDTDITVNPRYEVIEFPLLLFGERSALGLEFGEQGPVLDAPRPAEGATNQ